MNLPHLSLVIGLFRNCSLLRLSCAVENESGANMARYILVVEDDPDIRELLHFSLTRDGRNVVEAESAEDAQILLKRDLPELIVVDWMLPGMSGVNFAKSLRKDERTLKIPIIMLTARSEEADKLRSFEAGIDDYVTKPFSPKELIARIKALLRRTSSPEDESLVFAGIRLELNSHKAFVNEDRLALGPTEFKLLLFFMRNPDRVFDRSQLVDEVWGRSVVVEERTVDVHILRLRKVLKPWGRDHVIETVRGVGYRLAS